MVNPQMIEYIKQQQAIGVPPETIRTSLATNGWSAVDIEDGFKSLGLNTSAEGTPAVKYAGFWIRFVAYMVDCVILVIPVGIIQGVSVASSSLITAQLLPLIIFVLYFTLMTHYKGATLGKMLVGITVKSEDLQKLSGGRVALREILGRLVSSLILSIGYIIAAFTKKKQGLHDFFAHSVVVYKDPSKPHTAGIVLGVIIALILPIILFMGIAATFTLASLNVARTKADDAGTKARLTSIRAYAEVYENKNNSYTMSTSCSAGMFAEPDIQPILAAIKTEKTCYANGSTYAVSALLNQGSFCVDSTGVAAMGTAVTDGKTASCKQ